MLFRHSSFCVLAACLSSILHKCKIAGSKDRKNCPYGDEIQGGSDVPDLRPVYNQKTVVAFPAGMDVYLGILAVMLLKVKTELSADGLRINIGFYAGIPLAEHQQHGLVDIVVYQQD